MRCCRALFAVWCSAAVIAEGTWSVHVIADEPKTFLSGCKPKGLAAAFRAESRTAMWSWKNQTFRYPFCGPKRGTFSESSKRKMSNACSRGDTWLVPQAGAP